MTDPHIDLAADTASMTGTIAAMRATAAALSDAIEQARPSFDALADAIVTTVGAELRAAGLLRERPPARTSKAERRNAKQYLACRRRAAPQAPSIGIAACARRQRRLASDTIMADLERALVEPLDPCTAAPGPIDAHRQARR